MIDSEESGHSAGEEMDFKGSLEGSKGVEKILFIPIIWYSSQKLYNTFAMHNDNNRFHREK